MLSLWYSLAWPRILIRLHTLKWTLPAMERPLLKQSFSKTLGLPANSVHRGLIGMWCSSSRRQAYSTTPPNVPASRSTVDGMPSGCDTVTSLHFHGFIKSNIRTRIFSPRNYVLVTSLQALCGTKSSFFNAMLVPTYRSRSGSEANIFIVFLTQKASVSEGTEWSMCLP